MLSRFVAGPLVRRLGGRAFSSAGGSDDGTPKAPKEPSVKDILGEDLLSAVDNVATSQNPKNPEGRKRMRDALKAKLVETEKQSFTAATEAQTTEMLAEQSVVELLKSVQVQPMHAALPTKIRIGKKETVALRREILYQAIQKGYSASEAQKIAEDAVARAEERMIQRTVKKHSEEKAERAAKADIEAKIAEKEKEFYKTAFDFYDKVIYANMTEEEQKAGQVVEPRKDAPNVFSDTDYPRLGVYKEGIAALKESKLGFWAEWDKEWADIQNQSFGPKNGLEEQILWTKQGKLWPYPINNEHKLGEEENVGFQDHIFLERFLAKAKLPKTGPVAHFMELVCVGLSKNPHMTAAKKREHIQWYVDYFNEQKVEQVHRLHEDEQQAALNA